MTVAALDRVAAIQQQLAALSGVQSAVPAQRITGPAAAAPTTSFTDALAAAQQPAATNATAAPTGAAASGTPFGAEIDAAAQRHGLDPRLLKALVKQESGFDPSARSPAGAAGLTQLMPGTAAALGVTDPMDPLQALEGGAKYLAQQLKAFGGDVSLALAAYNAGPGNVQKHGGIPPFRETQNYVRTILASAGQEGFTP